MAFGVCCREIEDYTTSIARLLFLFLFLLLLLTINITLALIIIRYQTTTTAAAAALLRESLPEISTVTAYTCWSGRCTRLRTCHYQPVRYAVRITDYGLQITGSVFVRFHHGWWGFAGVSTVQRISQGKSNIGIRNTGNDVDQHSSRK